AVAEQPHGHSCGAVDQLGQGQGVGRAPNPHGRVRLMAPWKFVDGGAVVDRVPSYLILSGAVVEVAREAPPPPPAPPPAPRPAEIEAVVEEPVVAVASDLESIESPPVLAEVEAPPKAA